MNADYSIFILSAGINGLIVSIFIDNIKIMRAKNSKVIDQVTTELTVVFEIVDI